MDKENIIIIRKVKMKNKIIFLLNSENMRAAKETEKITVIEGKSRKNNMPLIKEQFLTKTAFTLIMIRGNNSKNRLIT